MSRHLIQQYLNDLSDLRRVSGTTRETVVREAFKTLIKAWGRARDLVFVPEYAFPNPRKERRLVDGALLHELRVPFGYWEAKDEKDDLDEEIATKLRRGYPQDNILFEDSRTVVLYQHRQEVMRCPVDDVDRLEQILTLFFAYERPEIAEFRKAVAQFQEDLPNVLAALREMIEEQHRDNPAFRVAAEAFLAHGRETINPSLTDADVREMLIQHILTEEIFTHVFNEADFHRRNNVASALYALEGEFFIGGLKKRTLKALEPYYAAIRAAAAQIANHHEKQTFLKVLYEGFYKVYNKKAADRLGVVYTPNEIVRFMVESADWLCRKHFGKGLIDKGVEILDPAAGTGTFITELIEYFRGQPTKLRWKYQEELHANEVAILPYYVANLNIEATYAAVTGEYEEFRNLCFVDTLDNVAGLRMGRGVTADLFGAVSEENVARIKRQNARKISVIIGNPPYNANQISENDNNKNRIYPEIDRRIKATYVSASRAQKTKLYDMYIRFVRWASDRIEENGIVAFITNRSFLDKFGFDGFRGGTATEFADMYIVDLGGDVRADSRLSGTTHNVFGIQTGVAISFLVKRRGAKRSRIRYTRRPPLETAEEKLAFLAQSGMEQLPFEEISPTARHDWLGEGKASFSGMLPVADKKTKAAAVVAQERSIFKLYSLGISTNRDEWLYDLNADNLENKIIDLLTIYNDVQPDVEELPDSIKWSETLRRRKKAGHSERYSRSLIRNATYRPFHDILLYQSPLLVDRPGLSAEIFPPGKQNIAICFSDVGSRTDFCVLATAGLTDLHFGAAVDAYQHAPRYRFVGEQRVDNITDWALAEFHGHYSAHGRGAERPITKNAIFIYVYAVLHDPVYRETYALDLRREFPRIPFHADFWRWADCGEALLALHLGYETVEPWPLTRIDAPDERSRRAGLAPRTILKPDKAAGTIVLDSETQLTGVPPEAWQYRLGNRSALEWVLDQHKERTPKDPTIRERFNTYRFADHKERVIDLLRRVARVSVETVAITEAMRRSPRP
ncbi:MAG: type ISP restriction/modification enzyme [Geminicoccaceae bacterium]